MPRPPSHGRKAAAGSSAKRPQFVSTKYALAPISAAGSTQSVMFGMTSGSSPSFATRLLAIQTPTSTPSATRIP